MVKDIINEDGSFVWVDPREKLEKVKKDLTDVLIKVAQKVESNENRQVVIKQNFNSYISTNLFNSLSVFPNVPYKDAVGVDKGTLREYILAFRELVSFIINSYFDYVPTKEQFNAFMGISYTSYNKLLDSPDPEIVAEIERIEGFLGELQLISAQSGMLKEKTTETRLRSDGIGHGMNLKNDEEMKKSLTINVFDKESVNKQLGNIMGKTWLENKK